MNTDTNITQIRKTKDIGFIHAPGDKVLVKPIGTIGTVMNVFAGTKLHHQYEVRYWFNDQVHNVWMYESELEEK